MYNAFFGLTQNPFNMSPDPSFLFRSTQHEEALANLIPEPAVKKKPPEKASPIKYCRTCYDHLAGKAGVLITESMLAKSLLVEKDNAYTISSEGRQWFAALRLWTPRERRRLAVLQRRGATHHRLISSHTLISSEGFYGICR